MRTLSRAAKEQTQTHCGKNVRQLAVDPRDENVVWGATTSGLFKTSDGGQGWTRIDRLGERKIEAVAIDVRRPGFIIAGEIFGGIWRSLDGGATWTGPLNTGIGSPNPYVTSLVFDPFDPTTIYMSDFYSGVYRSQDGGVTWRAFPDWNMSGLTVRAVKDLAIGCGMMYVATQGGGGFRLKMPSRRLAIPGGGLGQPHPRR